MKKRMTALLLLVCMLLTLMPVGALAEDTESSGEQNEDVVVQNDNDDSPTPPVNPCAEGHSYGPWQSNGNGTHTRTCTREGCDATDTADCSGNPATCTADSVCSDCGATLAKATGHRGTVSYTSLEGGHHRGTYSECGCTFEEACSGGTASCTELAKCDVCGGSYGNYNHFTTVCQHIDGTNTHGYYCSNPVCPNTLGKAPLRTETCSYTDATCTSPSECSKCFSQKGSIDPSNHVGETKAERVPGTETHNIVCQSCGKAIQKDVACTSDGKADCTHKAKCTACGGEMGELGNHVIKDSPATCLKAAKCDVCGQEVDKPLGHDRKGDDPCKRANCDCPHTDLWKNVDASAASAKCPDCGKTIDKTPLDVKFTVTGYGIGKPINGLTATCDNPNVTNVKATASVTTRAAASTFQDGTQYTITVSYQVANDCRVKSAAINGKPVQPGSSSVSVNMGNPETLYKITYKGVDSTAGLPTEYTVSSLPITLPDVSKTGHTFNGWTGNGATTPTKGLTIPKGTAKNLTFTASFTASKMTVTFDLKGHGTNYTQTVDYGKKCPTPKTPTDTDVIFVRWELNGSKYDFSKPVTGDITLTASWTPAGTIDFRNAWGKKQHATGNIPDLKKEFGKPTKSGYYFCGWYTNSNFTGSPINGIANLKQGETRTLYAKWKKMDTTNPKTGDTQFPELAAAVLALSTMSLGAVITVHKKKRIF